MQNQLPLFLPYDQVQTLPIVLKYQKIFDQLDLSDLPEFNAGIGANGTSQHALLRAFLIRSLESLKTVPALIRFLLANPALIYLCGFRNQIFASVVMAVDGGRCHPGLSGGLGQAETGRALGLDQLQGRLNQRLAQVAVMIAAFRHSRCRCLRRFCRLARQ